MDSVNSLEALEAKILRRLMQLCVVFRVILKLEVKVVS